jgi:hypothetical protein
LSDAVSLVRGDRFYTDDFTPKNLTNWGFAEVDSDLDVDSGNVMYKLIFCAFPHHFQSDSIYAHHPLVTPEENKVIFKGLKKSSHYSWDPPRRHTPAAIARNGGGPEKGGLSKELAPSKPAQIDSRQRDEVRTFMRSTTKQLIDSHAYAMPGQQSAKRPARGIDVVGDIISLSFVKLTAKMFSLSIKASNDKRQGAYTDAQLCTILSVIYAADSPRLSPGRLYELQRQAQDLEVHFKKDISITGLAKMSLDGSKSSIRTCGERLAEHQRKQGKKDLADRMASLLACSAMVPVLLVAESLDYHLEQGPEHMQKLSKVAQENTDASDDALMKQ